MSHINKNGNFETVSALLLDVVRDLYKTLHVSHTAPGDRPALISNLLPASSVKPLGSKSFYWVVDLSNAHQHSELVQSSTFFMPPLKNKLGIHC